MIKLLIINPTKILFKTLTYLGFLSVIGIYAPDLHEQYLVRYKGDGVVKLSSYKGSGTGFNVYINDKKYVLTNRHVCNLGKTHLTANGNGIYRRLKILKKDPVHDLCILEGLKNKRAFNIANSHHRQEKIHIIGHPRGAPLTLSSGRLIAKTVINMITIEGHKCGRVEQLPPMFQFLYGRKFICVTKYTALQSNAVSFGGNSGSPVVDNFGRVIGVLFAGNRNVEALSLMVPLKDINRFISTIK